MPDGWIPLRLGEAVEIKHGYAFPGAEFSTDPSYPTLVTPGNFRIGGGFQRSRAKTFTGDTPEDFLLEPGDLIVTMTDLSKTGDTLGYPAFVPEDRRYLHNQRIGKVTLRREGLVDLRYLAMIMRTASYRSHVLGTASGSTVRHTSPGRILDFKTVVPPLDGQRRIAGVLDALDKLIEASQKLCVDLRKIAATSYLNAIRSASTRTPLDECAQFHNRERIPLSKAERSAMPGPYPYYGATGVVDTVGRYLFEDVHILVGEDGSVVQESGSPVVQMVWGKYWVNNHAHVLSGIGISNGLLREALLASNVA